MIRWALILVVFALCQTLRATELVVTEFLAINDQTLADPAGEFDDWVECFNSTDQPLDLAGLYVSNDPEDPTLWQIPQGDTVIPPQGRVLLWFDNDPEQGPLHMPFRLPGEGGMFSITDRDGITTLQSIAYPPQHPDIASGRPEPASETFLFLLSPTPGDPNDPTGVSQLGGVTFSREPGIFQEPFELSLGTITEGASVRYTTDGKVPGIFAGKVYAEPFMIDRSTTIRTAVFIGTRQISPLQTQIYLATDDDVASFHSNLPVVLIDSRGHDFTKDTSLSRTFEPSPVSTAFLEPGEDARARVSSTPTYLGNAGMNVRGASSRAWPKKQRKFETWGDVEEDRAVGLLGMPADADWILAAPYFDKSLMRNHLTFRWWEDLGYESPRTRFCELFLDMNDDQRFTMEDYQGIYVLTEKIKRAADRLDLGPLRAAEGGGFEGSYAIEATNVNQHWVSRTGIRLKYVEPREAEPLPEAKAWIRDHFNSIEAAVHGDLEAYRELLDMPSHLDYDIMRELSRNIDGASTFLSFREGKMHMGPLWDYNQSFGLTSLFNPNPGWQTDGWNVEHMTQSGHWMKWWDHLDDDLDYQTAWNDRWIVLRETLLSNERLLGDIAAIHELLEEAAERNFDRWDTLGKAVWVTGGGTRADPGEDDRDTFAKEVAYVREWTEDRLAWIDSEVPTAPSFSAPSGAVPEGFLLEIGETEGFKPFGGTLHYTIDGSDPRLPGGVLRPDAVRYQDAVPLAGTVTVNARLRSIFGKWSSLRRATYLVGAEPATAENLTISEIHYNPKGSDATEFIELVNRGDRSVDLTGVRLADAVDFEFGVFALEPGEAILVVEDAEAFDDDQEGIAGDWRGRLANGGERLEVLAANGDEILSFAYDDSEEWPAEADGNGASLERVDLGGPLEASGWRASLTEGGTPGGLPDAIEALTYSQWQAATFEDPAAGDSHADPDGDGLVNVLEFAFGSDPLSRLSVAEISVAALDSELEFRYPALGDRAVNVTLEESSDLVSWKAAVLDSTTVADGQTVVAWTRGKSTRYVRLRVQPNP